LHHGGGGGGGGLPSFLYSVLVYSEFAGCSTDFKGALIVNPYDADKVAESINIALTMSSTTKQVKIRKKGGEGE